MGELVEFLPYYRGEQLYLPFIFVKEYVDPDIKWDEFNKQLIVTNNKEVYHIIPQKSQGLCNLESFSLEKPLLLRDDIVYIPREMLEILYNIEILEQKVDNIVSIVNLEEPMQLGRVTDISKLRTHPKTRSAWVYEVQPSEQVRILKEKSGWFWIETKDGRLGYMPKGKLTLIDINKAIPAIKSGFQPWKPLGEPIFSTWEYVYNKTADPAKIGDLAGVNVLAPTWFYLEEEGNVLSKADKEYSNWYHQQGKQVWAVFSNDCEIDLTHSFLADSNKRRKVIEQLLEYADMYDLDGYGIDFEYMYMEDKEEYVQFIRELVPIMHNNGLAINVYIIFHSTSERWSLCYDHQALAESADYLTVMAYDQHTALAGSSASMPWVEKGIIRMLEDVPSQRLVLGIPFYTRLWKEEPGDDGKIVTTKQTFSMEQMEVWLEEQKPQIDIDDEAGQHYIEIRQGKILYRMWLEDEYSLEKRIELVKKYRLAGTAAWRRGLEKDEVWSTLSKLLNKRW
jgi:spore germination protein YaaH